MSSIEEDAPAVWVGTHVNGEALPHVLVGMDDMERATALARSLARRSASATLAFGVEQLVACAARVSFDLAIVDAAIVADADAPFATWRRDLGSAPVVMLGQEPTGEIASAARAPEGILAVVDAWAVPDEIASRALYLLATSPGPRDLVGWGPLELDLRRRLARWRGTTLSLTPIQFRILSRLVQARGAVVTRPELERAVWGSLPIDDAARVIAHIRRIRTKIEADPSQPRFLLTARGEGFRLADPAVDEPGWPSVERRRGERRRPTRDVLEARRRAR